LAIYDDFWLGAESDNYTLHVSDYVESTAVVCISIMGTIL